jgi:hypothetical protein
MMQYISQPTTRIERAFGQLRAEREADLLPAMFVAPEAFFSIAGPGSVAVIGESGAGKTALRMALGWQGDTPGGPPQRLVVDWLPDLPPPGQEGSLAVQFFLRQVLDACAEGAARLLGNWPERFRDASGWVQETLVWFVHTYLTLDLNQLVDRNQRWFEPEGAALLRDLAGRVPHPVLRPEAPQHRAINELAVAVGQLGFDGVWLLVDNLEPWIESDPARLAGSLSALLSALAFFDLADFAVKLFVPPVCEPVIASSGAVQRQRLDVQYLVWTPPQLVELAEHRLAVALETERFELAQLYEPAALLAWLERYGGVSPRAWLELLAPVARRYVASAQPRPLNQTEWAEVCRRYPPRLRIDLVHDRVFLGAGEVLNLQPAQYKVLRYLYRNRHQAWRRDELYYLAYRDMSRIPDQDEPGWEDEATWSGILDTILWRLRRAIEPNPKAPLYIVSEKHRAVRKVRLDHTR